MNKAVFFDRDGTLIVDHGYNCRSDQLDIIDGAAETLLKLQQAGYLCLVITNQSGIAKGRFTESDYHRFNDQFVSQLSLRGAAVDATYYCPHDESDNCSCRKPRTGMADVAVQVFDLDISQCYFVGDKDGDVLCGKKLGCRTVRITSGYPQEVVADHVIADISDLATIITPS